MAGTTKFNDFFMGYSSYFKFFDNFKNNIDFYIQYKSILSAITNSDANPLVPCPTPTPCPTTSKTSNKTLIIVSCVLGGTCLVLICIILYYWKHKNGKR